MLSYAFFRNLIPSYFLMYFLFYIFEFQRMRRDKKQILSTEIEGYWRHLTTYLDARFGCFIFAMISLTGIYNQIFLSCFLRSQERFRTTIHWHGLILDLNDPHPPPFGASASYSLGRKYRWARGWARVVIWGDFGARFLGSRSRVGRHV